MSRNTSVSDVADEILQSILATPKRQRKLLNKTFWSKFGFKARTQERVEQVREALRQRSIMINFDDFTFGKETKDEWIVLSYVQPDLPVPDSKTDAAVIPIPMPPESWFTSMKQREFESEREVEYYFIVPLLEQLGYEESDFAIGYPVQMYQGVSKVSKEADFVVFNGKERLKELALLVLEAKRVGKQLTEDVVGQARAYAMWLTTPYYIVTNGDEIRIFLFRGALAPDVMLMNFRRDDLEQNWSSFFTTLNKAAVVDRKGKLNTMIKAGG